MINQVKDNLLKQGFNLSTNRILIGVSGGIDSMVLLDILHNVSQNLIVAHFNHQIRPEACADENFVRQFCEGLSIEFCSGQADVLAYAKEQGHSIEEAARILRYQFLFQKAKMFGCDGVAVAHNADDQAETVLMHLLRGSGTAGLKGMQKIEFLPSFSAEIPILRPLLSFTRQDIEAYQKSKQLEYREDQSNWDTKYDRNRIRHDLIPKLKTYNPNVTTALARLADNLANDWQIVESVRKQDWARCLLEKRGEVLVFLLPALQDLPQARLRNLLRHLVSVLSPDIRDFGYIRMMALVDFIGLPAEGKRHEIIDSSLAFIEGDQLMVGDKQQILNLLEKEYPQMDFDLVTLQENQTSIDLGKHWVLKIEHREIEESDWPLIRTSSDSEAWFDAIRVGWPMIIRTASAGDRFSPLGMNNHQVKLSDYFINEKVPNWCREKYPLLTISDEVVWVIGKRISEKFKIDSMTKSILHMELIKKEE